MAENPRPAAMRPKHPAHSGIELDGHGDLIPMEDRLPEDRAKAHQAARSKSKPKPGKPKKKPAKSPSPRK